MIDINKDTIIMAIAIIKTYPTLEKYISSMQPLDTIDEEYIPAWKKRWKEQKDISDTALLNGYKQPEDITTN
jgi:hypothetical protein